MDNVVNGIMELQDMKDKHQDSIKDTIIKKQDWKSVIYHKLRELQFKNWRQNFETEATLEEYLEV